MAKKIYESKIATQTKNFVNIKKDTDTVTEDSKSLIEPDSEPPKQAETTKSFDAAPAKKETANKTPIIEKKEQNNTVSEPAVSVLPDLDALVQAKLQELLSSGQFGNNIPSKAGRPRKYEEKTRIASIRLEESVFEYARKMGRTEYESMTEYINELIKSDMKKDK